MRRRGVARGVGWTTVVAPGGTVDLSVTLKEGTYTIYCVVRGHRKQGMEGTPVVRAGG